MRYEPRKCAYELLWILNPEKDSSDDLIRCISDIGNCYGLSVKECMRDDK